MQIIRAKDWTLRIGVVESTVVSLDWEEAIPFIGKFTQEYQKRLIVQVLEDAIKVLERE